VILTILTITVAAIPTGHSRSAATVFRYVFSVHSFVMVFVRCGEKPGIFILTVSDTTTKLRPVLLENLLDELDVRGVAFFDVQSQAEEHNRDEAACRCAGRIKVVARLQRGMDVLRSRFKSLLFSCYILHVLAGHPEQG
jgi:hypothetical protein